MRNTRGPCHVLSSVSNGDTWRKGATKDQYRCISYWRYKCCILGYLQPKIRKIEGRCFYIISRKVIHSRNCWDCAKSNQPTQVDLPNWKTEKASSALKNRYMVTSKFSYCFSCYDFNIKKFLSKNSVYLTLVLNLEFHGSVICIVSNIFGNMKWWK